MRTKVIPEEQPVVIDEQKYLTPQMIADEWMVSVNTIYGMLRKHALRGIRFGKQWRITQAEYKRFLESQGHSQ